MNGNEGEDIFTEIIALYEAIHTVKIDYSSDKPMPDKLVRLVRTWETRIDTLKDKLYNLNKY